MFTNLFYREKGLFLQTLHPVAALIYLGVLFALALFFAHPLYLWGLLVVIFFAIWSVDGLASWEGYLKVGLVMALMALVLNPLVMHAGENVIWRGPRLPVLGEITITLEAVSYGAAMGVRLLALISVFCLYNLMVHPDKVLGLFSRFAAKSALLLSLATRLFPLMVRRMESIREAQVARGVDFSSGTLGVKLARYLSLLNILVVTALEDALEIAEAMQARAFGSGRRSAYWQEIFRPRDVLCLACSLIAGAAAVYGEITGVTRFHFYPRLAPLVAKPETVAVLSVILFFLLAPVLIGWGWRRWPFFRSKI